MRIFFFPPVPLWSKEVTKSAEAHKHGRKLGERWLTVRLFKQGLSSSGSGRGAQCEQVSSNQPIALYSKTAENMPLLGSVLRGSTPENAYNKSMCWSTKPPSTGVVICQFVSLLSEQKTPHHCSLQLWSLVTPPRCSRSSLLLFVHLTSFCILSCSLYFSAL